MAVEGIAAGLQNDCRLSEDESGRAQTLCRECTLLCKRLHLFGGEVVAIDGSKFRAVNGKARNVSAAKLQRLLKEIDAKIDAYLKQLDSQDAAEATVATPTADEVKAQLRR